MSCTTTAMAPVGQAGRLDRVPQRVWTDLPFVSSQRPASQPSDMISIQCIRHWDDKIDDVEPIWPGSGWRVRG